MIQAFPGPQDVVGVRCWTDYPPASSDYLRCGFARSVKAMPGRAKKGALAVAWLGSLLLSRPVFDRLFKHPYVIIGIRQHALSAIRDDRCPANLDSIHDVHRAID